uniref:Thioredoxin domain-containing protein n=1 Tax=Hanusia phi TaxID=3032 RepID=A0A7S0HFD2_9CRYP|mmetsp:Transcript_19194/g.44038  ORF Transcript_19194/g.44038 Transcript_19194/m.44038 type:complete len:273 (+) Transcript_19194:297-1115(+)|eukprot:764796-Hanusia_phi.AAC.9
MIFRVLQRAKYVASSVAFQSKLCNPILHTKFHNVPLKIGYFQKRQASDGKKTEEFNDENMDRNVNLKAFAALAIVGSAIGAYFNIRAYERRAKKDHVTTEGPSYGAPKLGGDYMLIDQHGKLVSNKDLHGKWVFIYFGFTYCPDICPNELMKLREIMTALEKDGKGQLLQPVFITIDPERDGPQQLKDYLLDWDPRIIGLTGSPEQISDVCQKFRVYYSKAYFGSKPTDYLIDHSVMFYLMNPRGEMSEYFGQNMLVKDIASKIAFHIDSFK